MESRRLITCFTSVESYHEGMSRARRERTKRNAILLKQNTVVGTVGLSANANGPRLGMRQASQPTVAALYDRRFLSKHEPALAERCYIPARQRPVKIALDALQRFALRAEVESEV